MQATHEAPSQMSVHDNPQSNTNASSDMPDLEDAASDYVDVTSEAAAILAGDVVASQAFDMLDEEVLQDQLGEYPNVRKGVNILGPGVVGVAVYTMADNEVLKGIAVGHGLTTVRRAVDEGMDYLKDDSGGDSSTEGYTALPSGNDSLSGRRLAEPGMNAAASASGAGRQGGTVVQGG